MVLGKSWFAVLLCTCCYRWQDLEVPYNCTHILMHANTCATFLISVHPVISHLRDKSFDEQSHQTWFMVGKTSVLRPRRDAFFIDSQKANKAHLSAVEVENPLHLHTSKASNPPSPTHVCMHRHTLCLSVVVHRDFLQLRIHLTKGWSRRAVLPYCEVSRETSSV